MPIAIKEYQREKTAFVPDPAASLLQTAHVFHTCFGLRAKGLHSIIFSFHRSRFMYQSNVEIALLFQLIPLSLISISPTLSMVLTCLN
jgi:hypothetical protein